MRRTIHINCLLKDNMIVSFHISPNKRTMPRDYYKDFYYSGTSMENCDELYKVEYMSVEFEDKEDSNFNNYIFEDVAKKFYKQWKIHPKHWGRPAYEFNAS